MLENSQFTHPAAATTPTLDHDRLNRLERRLDEEISAMNAMARALLAHVSKGAKR